MLTNAPAHRVRATLCGHTGRVKLGACCSRNNTYRVTRAQVTPQVYFTPTCFSFLPEKVFIFQFILNRSRKVYRQLFLNGLLMLL